MTLGKWCAALAMLAAFVACGSTLPTPVSRGSPTAAPSVGSVSPSTPISSPSAPAPTPPPAEVPAPSPQPAQTFRGSISLAPAARIRFGPGLDMPVLDLARYGTEETFDGWFTRPDDTPMPDAVTGRIEAWSRDWYRLTDGRGWIHAGAVRGFPPAGLASAAWSRPSSLPAPTAGIVSVALDLQDQNATCEVASLKMVLTHQGISTSEQHLLDLVGVDARPPEVDDRGRIVRWGNPDRSFVGDPNGRAADLTGYGVYPGPIARAARQLGAAVIASGAVGPGTLYANLAAGHPAVAWIASDYRRGSTATWTAWDGATVTYSLKEHAVALVGVTPGWVLIDDPWWGLLWKTKADFEATYQTLGGLAVVTT